MQEINHKSSLHDLIPNQLYLYLDDGNGYCDYWVMSIINNHFIKCPAWERRGKPMTFSEIENDTIQYERVSLDNIPDSTSLEDLQYQLMDWYDQYQKLNVKCENPSFSVFDTYDTPETVMNPDYDFDSHFISELSQGEIL